MDLVGIQRRTVRSLLITQSLGGVGVTTGIAVAALLARDLSGSDTVAGLAQTFQTFGAALGAAGIAALSARHGRRVGLTTGYLVGAIGSALCVIAGVTRILPLMLAGAVAVGSASAANIQARYAATDLAEPVHRARALSIVVWATTVGAVLGPNLVGPGERLAVAMGIPGLTGGFFLGTLCLLLAAVGMHLLLRPDPLLVARSVAHRIEPADSAPDDQPRTNRWQVLRERPAVLLAIAGMALSHAVMVAVMVMTPLHMQHGHAELTIIGLVISIHILGMYAFAPIMGWAADRWGRAHVIAAGGVILVASCWLAGTSVEGASWRLGTGLFLLGLGWSAASVGSSALLTDETPLQLRAQVQGAADVVAAVTAAVGGAVAGLLVQWAGYSWLNGVSAGFAAAILVVAAAAGRAGTSAPERVVVRESR
jgi:MFS family permease